MRYSDTLKKSTKKFLRDKISKRLSDYNLKNITQWNQSVWSFCQKKNCQEYKTCKPNV